MCKILSGKNTSYTIFLYSLWGCHKHNCLKANINSLESLYESCAVPSQLKPFLMLCLRLSLKQEWVLWVTKNGSCRAATEPKAVLTVALGWTCWFVISNPLRFLWCRQLCVFLRKLACFLWDIQGSVATCLLTCWTPLRWLLWCLPGSPAERACADSRGQWLGSISPCARQVSTVWAKWPRSLLLRLWSLTCPC